MGLPATDTRLSTNQKGAWAEAEIVAAAVRLDLCVLRPLCEGRRYDIVIDLGHKMLRVQCKWAAQMGDVLGIRTSTSRYTPRGYVRTTYSPTEIDAIAIFSSEVNRCYLVPSADVEGQSYLYLRLAPTRNNQAQGVRWAADYSFEAQVRRLRDAPPSPAEDLRGRPRADTITRVQGL
jgi:hypothetical protein